MNQDGKFGMETVTRTTRGTDLIAQALRDVSTHKIPGEIGLRSDGAIGLRSGVVNLLLVLAPGGPDAQHRLLAKLLIAEAEGRMLGGAKDLAMMMEHNAKQ